jgi:hypothetical protein
VAKAQCFCFRNVRAEARTLHSSTFPQPVTLCPDTNHFSAACKALYGAVVLRHLKAVPFGLLHGRTLHLVSPHLAKLCCRAKYAASGIDEPDFIRPSCFCGGDNLSGMTLAIWAM